MKRLVNRKPRNGKRMTNREENEQRRKNEGDEESKLKNERKDLETFFVGRSKNIPLPILIIPYLSLSSTDENLIFHSFTAKFFFPSRKSLSHPIQFLL